MKEQKALIESMKTLGAILAAWLGDKSSEQSFDFRDRINDRLQASREANPWFTADFLRIAIQSWAKALQPKHIDRWVSRYPEMSDSASHGSKTVAIIMAGNIPMVGFHDLLCVLLTGHRALVKMSDSDRFLIPLMVEMLGESFPSLNDRVRFTEGPLKDFDAVIATGSDNTFRYFQHYLGKYPSILRKNRNSIAVLDGRESFANLDDLCHDVFTHFGMGCRSVSKVFVPRGYQFDDLLTLLDAWGHVGNHHSYRNNYDYRKSIMLINRIPFIDHPNLLLTENESLTSPLAVLHYAYYDQLIEVQQFASLYADRLQCVAGNHRISDKMVSFGETQSPELWDYADGIDTIAFLIGLNR